MRRAGVVVGALAGMVVLGSAPATAETPLEVAGVVTDPGDVLGEDAAAVETALTELADESEVGLYAVYVPDFGGADPSEWAADTARLSGLEDTEMLLAVAVGEETYEYSWWVAEDFPLLELDVEAVVTDEVEPRLEAGDWGGAARTLADGLDTLAAEPEATESTWTGTTTALAIGGVVVVLGVAHLLSRRRDPARSSR